MSLLDEGETFKESISGAGSGLLAKEAVSSAIGGAAAGVGGVFSVVGVGVASAASIIINQTSYQHKRASLREMYKDEIAAQLGKSPQKITDKDIELLARGDSKRGISGNKTLADELNKLTKRRNVGMLVTVLSILGTVAVIAAISPLVPVAGLSTLATIGVVASRMAVGFAVHKALEEPIKWASKKLFHLDGVTTHERIAELSRGHKNGKVITRAQVLSVFVGANNELSQFVTSQYGKPYDKLSVQEKQNVTEAMEQYIPITNIAKNLNSGSVKVSELAFAVEGKISGVEPNSVQEPLSLVGKVRGALRSVGERLHYVKQHHTKTTSVTPQSPVPPRSIVEYDNSTPARSFVERYEAEKNSSVGRTIH